jgi:hypothetical protein
VIKLHGIVAVLDVLVGRKTLSPHGKDITMRLFKDSVQGIIFRPKNEEVVGL